MPQTWKTVIVILVLATAAPAAVILAQNLSIGGGGNEDTLPPGGAVETPEPVTLFCRGAQEFRISNTSTEVSRECCLAAVIGEITNTCNSPLLASVSAALLVLGYGANHQAAASAASASFRKVMPLARFHLGQVRIFAGGDPSADLPRNVAGLLEIDRRVAIDMVPAQLAAGPIGHLERLVTARLGD